MEGIQASHHPRSGPPGAPPDRVGGGAGLQVTDADAPSSRILRPTSRAGGPTPDQYQMVRADAGWSSAAAPDPPSRRDGSDVQFPGHPRRRNLSRPPSFADGEQPGPVRLVQPGPEPAGPGLLDVPPEALSQWHPPPWSTRRARAAAGPTRWSSTRARGGEAPTTHRTGPLKQHGQRSAAQLPGAAAGWDTPRRSPAGIRARTRSRPCWPDPPARRS